MIQVKQFLDLRDEDISSVCVSRLDEGYAVNVALTGDRGNHRICTQKNEIRYFKTVDAFIALLFRRDRPERVNVVFYDIIG